MTSKAAGDLYAQLQSRLAVRLQALGFRGSRTKFTFPGNDYGVIALQKRRGDVEVGEVLFTVNVTWVRREDWEAARRVDDSLPKVPGGAQEYVRSWYARLPNLAPEDRDAWWSLRDTGDVEAAVEDVSTLIRAHVVPQFQLQAARDVAAAPLRALGDA